MESDDIIKKDNNDKPLDNNENTSYIINNNFIEKIQLKNNEINELKHQIFELENYIYNYNKKEKEYEKEINNNDNLIKQLHKQNKELLKNKNIIEEDIIEKERIQHIYDYNTDLLKKLRNENEEVILNLTSSISNVKQLKQTISELEDSKIKYQNDLETLNNELDEKMNERLINKDSDNINGKLLTEKQNEINNLQYEILDLKGKLEEFQYKILLADRDYRQGKVDIDELKRKNKLDLESYEDKISILKHDIEMLKKKKNDYQNVDNIKIIKKKIQNLEEEHKIKKKQLNNENNNNNTLFLENEKKQLINYRLKRDFINLKNGNIQQVLIDRERDQIEEEEALKESLISD